MFPEKTQGVPTLRFDNFSEIWEHRKLSEVGKISTGNTPSTKDLENYSDSGMQWVTPSDIKSLIITDTAKKLSLKGQQSAKIVSGGSILVTCIASIGKNTLVTRTSSFNQQINAITPFEAYDSYFLLTQSYFWSKFMKKIASLGTMQIVNKAEFSNLKSKYPGLEEQKKIGLFFKEIDNILTLHQRKLDSLERLKASYLQLLFPQ
ncbi:restriction endonuclease subunit S [Ruoffia tabacinasalis]|nr:restriction endonuclease subunit S [Ruoffia tabacinasalis]